MKYCKNCKQNVKPKKDSGIWALMWIILTIFLTLLLSIFGLIIATVGMAILYHFANEKCPICDDNNFKGD